MTDEQKAVLIALVTGLLAGFFSKSAGSGLGLIVGAIAAYALSNLQKTLFREKKQGWSVGNVVSPYIFTWIITWIILVNI
ncbi:MAG: hypothetical protein HY516_03075 [Candidatus Aenigmarchaeota archaeon]|nr:hypothetical protein [Candidatus Aenigmarchaeota archaeon]